MVNHGNWVGIIICNFSSLLASVWNNATVMIIFETISCFGKEGGNVFYYLASSIKDITILDIFIRLYGKIIKHFLEQKFSQIETEAQAGFREGRSIIDHIFCLKRKRQGGYRRTTFTFKWEAT
jgi:hypothetical protein